MACSSTTHQYDRATLIKTHHPRKRFGQNFLRDEIIIDRIITAISPNKNDHIIEIGPGLGVLTEKLLPQVHKLDVIEIDRDLIPKLKNKFKDFKNLTIHSADALTFDFKKLVNEDQKLRIVGNLPYNISSPLLFHLISQLNAIKDMCFLLQKEVVERLCASSGIKSYGRLSVMVQYFCQATNLFIVPPEAFKPKPKVNSAMVHLIPHKKIPFIAKNIKVLENVVRLAFTQRRKTLQNALKKIILTESLSKIDIDPKKRPEQITIEQYVKISNFLVDHPIFSS